VRRFLAFGVFLLALLDDLGFRRRGVAAAAAASGVTGTSSTFGMMTCNSIMSGR
jgi:hypothetical protein